MLKSEIEATLAETFEDFVLDPDEKNRLREAFSPFQYDISTLQYARNKAFTLVRQQFAQSPENHVESLKWLEGVIKTIDSVRQEHSMKKSRAYFSPGTSCVDKIIASLNSVKENLDICVFTISDDVISKAIIDAHKRGVEVRIITDDEKVDDKGSDIAEFVANEISVKTDDSPAHMHHKFAIFDKQILLNGSFNWTRSASKNNNENIVVDATPHLVSSFQETFDGLWGEFIWAK
ncbi:MAG: phospholipase D-like domain-containing protein [Psychrosphaera sp.]|nr:phospholipase D-like domain-containing protein [Psychrosphaera sp.]